MKDDSFKEEFVSSGKKLSQVEIVSIYNREMRDAVCFWFQTTGMLSRGFTKGICYIKDASHREIVESTDNLEYT